MKDKTSLPRILAILLSMLSIVGIFLPYIGTTTKEAEWLMTNPDRKVHEKSDMTAKDLIDITLYEYAKVHYQIGDDLFKTEYSGLFYTIFFSLPAIIGLIALIAALRKHTIFYTIQGILLAGSLRLINFDIVDRRIMPNDGMVWSIAHWYHYVVAAGMVVTGIWLLISKIQMRNEAKRNITN